jgi:hypothetical protein
MIRERRRSEGILFDELESPWAAGMVAAGGVDTETVPSGLNGESDTRVTTNDLAERVLSSWTPIEPAARHRRGATPHGLFRE